MSRFTLDETWENCIKMWEYIVKHLETGKTVEDLKVEYLEKYFPDVTIRSDCFFCDYACNNCYRGCPGKFVNPTFSCIKRGQSYDDEPIEFYKEIKRLYKIYKKENHGNNRDA